MPLKRLSKTFENIVQICFEGMWRLETKNVILFEGFNPSKLRKEYFYKNYSLDNELISLLSNKKILEPEKIGSSHDFLLHPLTHYTHIYLVEYLHEFIKHWFNGNSIKILDWGCGKGQIAYLCKKRGMNIICCDIFEKKGDSAFGQYTPIIDTLGINVLPLEHPYKLPFSENSFEAVLSFGVLEHVQNDEESVKEIHRVLKPNGLFFCFFLPFKYSWRNHLEHFKGNYYHDRLYSIKRVNNLIENNRLKIMDLWIRDVIPFRGHSWFKIAEKIDQWFYNFTPLKYFATHIEFVAYKS
jgi:ubiquinone/menaquinone biosynthesis C-methylase UbiE